MGSYRYENKENHNFRQVQSGNLSKLRCVMSKSFTSTRHASLSSADWKILGLLTGRIVIYFQFVRHDICSHFRFFFFLLSSFFSSSASSFCPLSPLLLLLFAFSYFPSLAFIINNTRVTLSFNFLDKMSYFI